MKDIVKEVLIMAPIMEFKDDYRFLSNFYPSPFVYNDVYFSTNEHFYQAHKAIDRNDFLQIAQAPTPGAAPREWVELWGVCISGMYIKSR